MLKRTPNTSKLTKTFIESKVSQELVVSKYLDIPLEVVKDCVEHNHLIESVFRDDDVNVVICFKIRIFALRQTSLGENPIMEVPL